MNKEFLEVEAIFNFFKKRIRYFTTDSGWIVSACSTNDYYDDGADFIEAFNKVSPSRKPDPSQKNARARLNRRLKKMVEDGWIDRHRQANQVEYMGEAKWQYVYQPRHFLVRDWKERGGSPTQSAKEYLGIKD